MSRVQAELPLYKSHKEVRAAKIVNIIRHPTGEAIITPEGPYAAFWVSANYVKEHNPQIGGYFIQYRDGYQSWSPASEFENGYTPVSVSAENPLPAVGSWGWASRQLSFGNWVCRKEWGAWTFLRFDLETGRIAFEMPADCDDRFDPVVGREATDWGLYVHGW